MGDLGPVKLFGGFLLFCFKRHVELQFLTFLPKSKPLFFNLVSSEVLSGNNFKEIRTSFYPSEELSSFD